APAADAELSAHGREREDGQRGIAAVPITLLAPPATDDCRTGGGVELGGGLEVAHGHARFLGSAVERPLTCLCAQPIGPARIRCQELRVGSAGLEQMPMDRQCHW